MNYYAVTRKEDTGCPLGMLRGILFPNFASDAHRTEYGKLPWYWNPSRGEPHEPFPDGLHYITADATYNFDLRSDAGDFYLASSELIELCARMNVRFEDKKPIAVVSRKGRPVSDKQYWVCRFVRLSISMVATPASVLAKQGSMTRVRSLRIAPELNQDLFKLMLPTPDVDTLFCSERFRDAAERAGFRGIAFMPVSEFPWPPERDDAEMAMAHIFDDQLPKPI